MIILDTDVLSELMRPQPLAQVLEWFAEQPQAELFTTSITEAEIFYGIELLPAGKRRSGLLEAATILFEEVLATRIFVFDSDAARDFAKIAAHRRTFGRPLSQSDAQIAAIALVQGAKLATHNVADFTDCGFDVVNPWTDS